MMGYADFKRLKSDAQVTLNIQRQFDEKETTRSGTLIKHTIGWTIRARKPATADEFGFFHVHWAPKEGHATINHNISAHFKPNHASPKKNNRGNLADLPLADAALLYNHFVLLNAEWNGRSPSCPQGATIGWTRITTHITTAMVNDFRAANDQAALRGLAVNPLYELAHWEHEAWNSFMWWMAGA